MPIILKDGLAYIKTLGRPTDQELEIYPHIFFTSPDTWEPSLLDHEFSPEDEPTWSQLQDTRPFYDPLFDAQGDLNQRIITTLNTIFDLPDHNDTLPFTINSTSWQSSPHHSLPSDIDWAALQPYFGWAPISSIQNTFKVTTRYGPAASTQDYLKKHFKARNPAFNIPRQNEAVATDTVFSDTPALADGSTMAQLFCGRDTLVCDAYGIKSTKQFINTLADNISNRGAMHTLISDGVSYEISKKVTDLILRSLFIADYQSEPYHQHQNKAENHWGTAN